MYPSASHERVNVVSGGRHASCPPAVIFFVPSGHRTQFGETLVRDELPIFTYSSGHKEPDVVGVGVDRTVGVGVEVGVTNGTVPGAPHRAGKPRSSTHFCGVGVGVGVTNGTVPGAPHRAGKPRSSTHFWSVGVGELEGVAVGVNVPPAPPPHTQRPLAPVPVPPTLLPGIKVALPAQQRLPEPPNLFTVLYVYPSGSQDKVSGVFEGRHASCPPAVIFSVFVGQGAQLGETLVREELPIFT